MLKSKEIRGMKTDERTNALAEAQKDLMHERGVAAMGGAPANPGKIRMLRRQIARIVTIQRESGGAVPPKSRATPKTAKAKTSKKQGAKAPGARKR